MDVDHKSELLEHPDTGKLRRIAALICTPLLALMCPRHLAVVP